MKARRLFSVTLALLMVMSAVPLQVFATAPTVQSANVTWSRTKENGKYSINYVTTSGWNWDQVKDINTNETARVWDASVNGTKSVPHYYTGYTGTTSNKYGVKKNWDAATWTRYHTKAKDKNTQYFQVGAKGFWGSQDSFTNPLNGKEVKGLWRDDKPSGIENVNWFGPYFQDKTSDAGDNQSDIRRFKGTFTVPEGSSILDSVTLSAVGNYAASLGKIVPINDNIYVFVYPEKTADNQDFASTKITNDNFKNFMVFWTGTSGPSSFLGINKTASVQLTSGQTGYSQMRHTDSWYAAAKDDNIGERMVTIASTYGITNFDDVTWIIDVFVEEFADGGGMDRLDVNFVEGLRTSVTVNYYKDSITNTDDEDHYLGSVSLKNLPLNVKINLEGGTEPGQLNHMKSTAGTGYLDGVQSNPDIIFTQPGSHTIDVLYNKNLKDVTIEYYVKNIGNEGLDNKELEGHNFTGTASFGTAINENMSLTVGGESLPAKKVIPGYTFHSVHGSSGSTVGNGNNKLRLLYTKDISVTFKSADTNKGTINGATDNALVSTGAVGAALTEPGKSAVLGYEFSHWSTDEAGNNSVTLPSTFPASDVTYYGQWKEKASDWVTVTFESADTNKGTVSPATKRGIKGSELSAAATSAKLGYEFDKWVGAVPATFPDTDTTYTAQWKEKASDWVTITFAAGENGSIGEEDPLNHTLLKNSTFPTRPTPTAGHGYKFDGWYDGDDKVTEFPEFATETKMYTAKFVPDDGNTKKLSYSVRYYLDGELKATVPVEKDVWIHSTTLPVDKEAINTSDYFDGKFFFKTDPATIPDEIAGDGVIEVHYSSNYTIKYVAIVMPATPRYTATPSAPTATCSPTAPSSQRPMCTPSPTPRLPTGTLGKIRTVPI